MVNRRAAVELTQTEQRELLESARVLQLASINPDGRPHLVPMWFELDEDGLIVFTTYGKSQKARNLERDPRLTVLVEAGEAYEDLRGVSYDARAEVVRDPPAVARAMALVGAKYGRHSWAPREDGELPTEAYKRIAVRVHVERARSWDHRKL